MKFSLAACFAWFVLGFSSALPAADYFPPPDSQGGWRVAKDAREVREKAGLDAAWLERAYLVGERGTQNGGLLVVRHGWLAFEKYFGRASRNANPEIGRAHV